jgi:hypothetical protein
MTIAPKIDYPMLGAAVEFYRSQGYEYREVPWIVGNAAINATLPADCSRYSLGVEVHGGFVYSDRMVVGSAEQSFIAMGLPPGRYVGVTPCFRVEPTYDVLHQSTFMKVELFDNRSKPGVGSLVRDAKNFMERYDVNPVIVQTEIGEDLMLDNIEVGSYGYRNVEGFGCWAYGTGLALPRFSVAMAFQKLVC